MNWFVLLSAAGAEVCYRACVTHARRCMSESDALLHMPALSTTFLCMWKKESMKSIDCRLSDCKVAVLFNNNHPTGRIQCIEYCTHITITFKTNTAQVREGEKWLFFAFIHAKKFILPSYIPSVCAAVLFVFPSLMISRRGVGHGDTFTYDRLKVCSMTKL